MDAMEAILTRRSYRGSYGSAGVPREHLRQIMKAGLAAPSGCNAQTTSLIAVDDPGKLRKISAVMGSCLCKTAPALICVLTRRVIAYGNQCFCVQDYSAAIENMLLAIVALGYQSCWIEGYITGENKSGPEIAKILGVPDDAELVCCLPVGIAQEPVGQVDKLPFSARAWFNQYGSDDDKS